MKIYLAENVHEAAKNRIRFLFSEFGIVIVAFSGGKDSTVLLNLALEVAEEVGYGKLAVVWLDQEAEWQATADYVKTIMDDPRVEPYWLQIPLTIANSTSTSEEEENLHCWAEDKEDVWIRRKDPISIKENIFGTTDFFKMFSEVYKHIAGGESFAALGGVRAEESPSRLGSLTNQVTYKDITWGKQVNRDKGQFIFYPLYDWSYTDIWKAIHDHGWPYCAVYDYFFRYGVKPRDMRVSNLHHETAIHNLYYLQEIEKDTWKALVRRLPSINTTRHVSREDLFTVRELPFMFDEWPDYRDHLLENLCPESGRESMRKKFAAMEIIYSGMKDMTILYKAQVRTVLLNDWAFTKLKGFDASPYANAFRKWKKGELEYDDKNCKWIPDEEREKVRANS